MLLDDKDIENINKKKKVPTEISINKQSINQTLITESSSEVNMGNSKTNTRSSPKLDIRYLISNDVNTHYTDRFKFLINIRDKNGNAPDHPEYDPTTLFIDKESESKFTPFEKQFWEIKKNHWDKIVFFKKGKFYELYEIDADIARKLFDLRVKERINMRMAGFPDYTYDIWANKFLKEGYTIVRVDERENGIAKKIREKETNAKKEKIIQRDITEIITPSTIYNFNYIDNPLPFYIAILISTPICHNDNCSGDYHYSIMLYDASINFIYSDSVCDSFSYDIIKTIFAQYDIKEVLTDMINIKFEKTKVIVPTNENYCQLFPNLIFRTPGEEKCFNQLYCYFQELKRTEIFSQVQILPLFCKDIVNNSFQLDAATIQNMDILTNNFDKTTKHSLFSKINYCSTPFGVRKLRNWLLNPLINVELIKERHNLTDEIKKFDINQLKILLTDLGDIERIHCRLKQKVVNINDLRRFFNEITKIIKLLQYLLDNNNYKEQCSNFFKPQYFITNILDMVNKFNSQYKIVKVTETEYHVESIEKNIELSAIEKNLDNIEIQLHEELKTIQNYSKTQVSFKHINKDIYQIEIDSNKFYSCRQDDWEISSKTQKTIRFYTKTTRKLIEEYKELEEKIFQTKNILVKQAVESLISFDIIIRETIEYVGTIDCYLSYAIFNTKIEFCRPTFIDSTDGIEIINVVNPIFENYITNDFVPSHSISILTGPNMGGKSTFLRSLCLNIILCQMGLHVAAKKFCVPVFDNIFTRIGANDSLLKNESTFMVEMNECSKILNTATRRSFVIIDELGRGTSIRDGTAIAESVLKYLQTIGCFVLFSTHYHVLANQFQEVDKYSMAYDLINNQIVFKYKLSSGIVDNSYGIYVAKLAGVPEKILQRAEEIKKTLS